MKLSSRERRLLEQYKRFRDDPPTVWKLISLSAIALVTPAMVIAIAICVLAALEMLELYVAMFFVGMAVGAYARDCGRFIFVQKVWPVYRLIVNWEKVDQLLAADARNQIPAEIREFI